MRRGFLRTGTAVCVATAALLSGCETLEPARIVEATNWGQLTRLDYPPGYNNSAHGYRELWATNTTATPICVQVVSELGTQRVTAPPHAETLILGRGQVPRDGSASSSSGPC